ncbi:MAG TPA: pitrilysin family protein [Thermoplasmata archaeon]|nr:pitrilysin family protein [Thermoplasmata archaeon]
MPPGPRLPPPTHRFRLANGLSVILAPVAGSPTASVWVWYRVGSKNEWPGVTGVSHWVEHMLFEGSPHYRKGAIDRAVSGVGGSLNAFTEYDFTAYFTTVPREHLGVPLDIEADRMTRSSLTPEEVERERVVILSEREGNENWPEFRVDEELYSLAYRHHPYRWDPLGRPDDIRSLTPAQLADYYHRFYGPRNATLVVTGGFDPVSVAADVRRRFSSLPATGADPTVREHEDPQRGERRATLRGPGTTPIVEVAWHAPPWGDRRTAAALLLDVVLGGESRLFSSGFGFGRTPEHPAARLYRALVDTGLAIRASSEYRPKQHPGLFSVGAQAVHGVPAARIEEVLLREVDRFAKHGPTVRELAEARVKIEQGAALAYEGATLMGFRLGYFSLFGPEPYEGRLLRQALRMPIAEVRAAGAELLGNENRCVVHFEPDGGPRA